MRPDSIQQIDLTGAPDHIVVDVPQWQMGQDASKGVRTRPRRSRGGHTGQQSVALRRIGDRDPQSDDRPTPNGVRMPVLSAAGRQPRRGGGSQSNGGVQVTAVSSIAQHAVGDELDGHADCPTRDVLEVAHVKVGAVPIEGGQQPTGGSDPKLRIPWFWKRREEGESGHGWAADCSGAFCWRHRPWCGRARAGACRALLGRVPGPASRQLRRASRSRRGSLPRRAARVR